MQRQALRLKQEEVTQSLRQRLQDGSYQVSHLLPPERALAAEFGVSRPTLRKALQPLIRDGLLLKIPGVGSRVVAPEPEPNAVRPGWRVIGLVLPDITNRFFVEVTEAIEYTALQRGYQLLLCSSRHDLGLEELHIRQLAQRRVDGVVLAHDPHRDFPESLQALEAASIPFVLLFAVPRRARFDTVVVDDWAGVSELMRYLLSLGHRRIAFCRPVPGNEPHPRERAYVEIMRQNELEVPERFLVPFESLDGGLGEETLQKLLTIQPRPTAIFAGNDRTALLVLKHLASLQVKVPDQVSVAGFDNLRFTADLPVPLTTVDQPKQEMGRRAVELLLERIELGRSTAPRQEVFRPRIVIRDSCSIAPASGLSLLASRAETIHPLPVAE